MSLPLQVKFEDIISLLHCFAMKMYSSRRKKKLL